MPCPFAFAWLNALHAVRHSHNDAPTVVRVRAEAAHKSKLEDYNNYEAAKRGCAKFLRNVVGKVWYNNLKDAETFYTQVTALEVMTFLDLNSGGLHAVDMLSLHMIMHQYRFRSCHLFF